MKIAVLSLSWVLLLTSTCAANKVHSNRHLKGGCDDRKVRYLKGGHSGSDSEDDCGSSGSGRGSRESNNYGSSLVFLPTLRTEVTPNMAPLLNISSLVPPAADLAMVTTAGTAPVAAALAARTTTTLEAKMAAPGAVEIAAALAARTTT
jgi:hypothetical protein